MTGRDVHEGVRVSFDANRFAGAPRGELFEDAASGPLVDDRIRNPIASLDLEDLGLQIDVTTEHLTAIFAERMSSITQIYTTLDLIKTDLDDFFPKVPEVLPAALSGRLVNSDGTDAGYVSVRALEPSSVATADIAAPWTNPQTTADACGAFKLSLPPRPVGNDGMVLVVSGSSRATELQLRRNDLIAGNGKLGVLPLDVTLTPLPSSVVAELGD